MPYTPDGRIVYILTNQDGTPSGSPADLWVYDPATGSRQRRTSELTGAEVGGRVVPVMPAFVLSLGRVLASVDSQCACAPAQCGGEVYLLRIGLSGSESHETIAAGPRAYTPVQIRGESVLFAAYGITGPGDLYLHDTATNTQSQ